MTKPYKMLKASINLPFYLCLLLTFSIIAPSANALEWPQEVQADEGTIVVYQPQPEKLEGNVLTGRSAMSLELKDKPDPIFGTFWFSARLDTDLDADTAVVRDIKVEKVRWPDSKDAGEQRFTTMVNAAIPKSGFTISMEQLSASLATADLELKSLENLNNDPPKIVFREELAVLLLYDGEPQYTKIENSNYERALNTPFVVVRDNKSRYYLSSGQLWYQASNALGPWKHTTSPPADLVKMMPAPEDDTPAPATPPEVVVATEPTELIVSDGKPKWDSLPGGEVLYVSNTESPWLRDLSTGNMYLLLSGRWFRSKSNDGPWTFVRADELPAAFADIPPASDIGGLRTSVAGTPEAEEAVLDAQIPQTAAISKDATLEVEYDGKPEFEAITGTSVAYAVNTPAQVLKINNRYYAADNGVWFTSSAATGPWKVAEEVPEEAIAEIPPSSPVYNTTHVHIYESTPEVVYVGYTPGYMWSFPYYGVPVYGTGWRYRPFWGPYYYPRPPTWGFNVGYNPWTGWNFGVSWSNGFFSMGVSFGGGYNRYRRPYGGGWYGGGYRGPTIINTGDINIGNTVNVGNRTNIGNKLDRGTNVNRNSLTKTNLYNRPENKNRKADRATVQRDFKQAKESRNRQNNVYADKNGNVSRRDNDKWQTREQGSWKDDPKLNNKASPETRDRVNNAANTREVQKPQSQPTTKPQQRPETKPASKPSSYNRQTDLNRANQARKTGASRQRQTQNRGGRQRR